VIDTLKLSRRLHEAGMTREAAEALTEGLADAFEASVASKNDLRATEERLAVRIDAVEHRMDERFAAVEQRMDERFAAVDARFTAVEQRMDERFSVAEQREDEKLASLENRLTARMEAFHWRTLAGMAAMLLAHLIVIWRLLAA
jgi:hypothetical protein